MRKDDKNSDRPEVAELTRVLQGIADDGRGLEALYAQVYSELRRQAASWLRRSPVTLQPTELVAELYLKLEGSAHQFENRRHFFGACAQAMRQVMADHARRRMSEKRGSGERPVELDEERIPGQSNRTDVFDVSLAIEKLRLESERSADILELRYFGGLSIEEAAAVTEVSVATANRDWRFARAWLADHLGGVPDPGD